MNHSCDPNIIVEEVEEEEEEMGLQPVDATTRVARYQVVARRPILAEDELTCDYTLGEYDGTEKGIDACRCGAGDKCLNQVRGFKVREGCRGGIGPTGREWGMLRLLLPLAHPDGSHAGPLLLFPQHLPWESITTSVCHSSRPNRLPHYT